ncbi:hypothetical protein PAHAL_1G324200 [Panicum hallii]|uniref:Uncharacterized protein n=1 Tax=Panicum hallii TaxID=206008 RepID=A0A2T8KWZ7_9POAL|nr:hypothetical protein PAHAL_1G324200 [Panicum hallii]
MSLCFSDHNTRDHERDTKAPQKSPHPPPPQEEEQCSLLKASKLSREIWNGTRTQERPEKKKAAEEEAGARTPQLLQSSAWQHGHG